MAVTVITKNNGSPLVIGLVGVSIISWILKKNAEYYILYCTYHTINI